MAIDTPARLAILGAGPMGLEAALYARFLGYEVVVFEKGEVAQSVRQWGHVRMFTPFGMNRTTLGVAAIQAQDETYRPPADDALLTGHEWVERYLAPLANTDLLSDHLRPNTSVVAVGKEELLKGDMARHSSPHAPREESISRSEMRTIEDRGDFAFRVLSRNADGEERVESFDGVIDCTGVFATANWAGQGGIPAIGEAALLEQIEYRLPDILGSDRERYAGKHTLLIGGGTSAATNVVALAELSKRDPATRVTWITRREGAAGAGGPIEVIENDRFLQRATLARQANALAAGGGAVMYWARTDVKRISAGLTSPARRFEVELSGEHAGTIEVDEIIANVGFRPARGIAEALQVELCCATDVPLRLATELTGQEGGDCLDQKARGASTLIHPEPNFYILGAKSYGRQSNFLLSVGYEQIREVFTLIGDRPSLNLYSSAVRLMR